MTHNVNNLLSEFMFYFKFHFKCIGSVAERSKALVLGTSLFGGVGSNPTAATGFELKTDYIWLDH